MECNKTTKTKFVCGEKNVKVSVASWITGHDDHFFPSLRNGLSN